MVIGENETICGNDESTADTAGHFLRLRCAAWIAGRIGPRREKAAEKFIKRIVLIQLRHLLAWA